MQSNSEVLSGLVVGRMRDGQSPLKVCSPDAYTEPAPAGFALS